MAKKQNKNLWLLVAGIVIVGIFFVPKLGLFSTLTPETINVRDSQFETIDDIYDNYKDEYTLNCDDFPLFNNGVILLDGEDVKGLFFTKECGSADYLFVDDERYEDHCITELPYVGGEVMTIHGVTVVQGEQAGEIFYFWCENNNILATASSLELLNAHFGIEDTNGGTAEDKWYNDCLFNYGEEDKCFSILYGLFALGGILLLMIFMRK